MHRVSSTTNLVSAEDEPDEADSPLPRRLTLVVEDDQPRLLAGENQQAAAPAEGTASLTVFWEGTGNALTHLTTQVGLFYELTAACDLSSPSTVITRSGGTTAFKMGFDGCSVTHGLRGLLCAVGLRSQCASVVARCRELLALFASVSISVLGVSRGGVAGLLLARALQAAFPEHTEKIDLSLCLVDPVPGNLVWLSRLLACCQPSPRWEITTAAACLDVSQCAVLRNVLALYPYQPLADAACHAPVLPLYPLWCGVEEDGMLGLHDDAIKLNGPADNPEARTGGGGW